MQEIASAKVNLALHVRGRMADGYHRIETVFAFAEEGDRLTVAQADELVLEVTGPFAGALGAEDNLVLRAGRMLRERFAIAAGAKLGLEKRLPVAAGLGGGSADAAAALRLLARWWEIDVGQAELGVMAAKLGADVPACLLGRTARGEGRGDDLAPIEEPGLAGTPLLLVNPRFALSTSDVFGAWDGLDRGPLDDWRSGRNDLTAPAITLVPKIQTVLAAFGGAEFVRMSGSGATCFGLYADARARDADEAVVRRKNPGWWAAASRLR